MKRHTSLLVLTLLFTALISCSYENTATVTIDTGIRQQAQRSWIDHLLAWISFSRPVKADTPPDELYVDKISVTISASDMETITQSIPRDTGRITLEVPAGSQRTFEVVGNNTYYSAERFYGGITTLDLTAGQQVTLDIAMGKLFFINDGSYYYSSTNSTITITPNSSYNYNPTAFKIYKDVNDTSILEYVVTGFSTQVDQYGDYSYTIENITLENGQTYFLSGVNQYGEGDKYPISMP